jgi:hypothetical protein
MMMLKIRPRFGRFGFGRTRATWRTSAIERLRPIRSTPDMSRTMNLSLAGMAVFAVGLLVGVHLAWLAGSRTAKRRRMMLSAGVARSVRRTARQTSRVGRRTRNRIQGQVARLRERGNDMPDDDPTLVDRVQSRLFREDWVPKGRIVINAENGTVVLRGVAEQPDDIDKIVAVVASVRGVRRVHSMLHLPGTPAPTGDSLASSHS